jgi:HTH domain
MNTICAEILSRKTAMTVQELATILNVSDKSVYKAIAQGLPCIHILSCLRLDPKTTADWLEARTTSKVKTPKKPH